MHLVPLHTFSINYAPVPTSVPVAQHLVKTGVVLLLSLVEQPREILVFMMLCPCVVSSFWSQSVISTQYLLFLLSYLVKLLSVSLLDLVKGFVLILDCVDRFLVLQTLL